MNPSNVFPPEALLHGAEFVDELIDDFFARKNVRTAWIVGGHAVEKTVEAVESVGHEFTHPVVGAVNAPAQNDVDIVTSGPESGKVLWIALAVRVEAQEVGGVGR